MLATWVPANAKNLYAAVSGEVRECETGCSQEEKGADKLARHGHEMISRAIGDPHEEGRGSGGLHLLVFTCRCYSVGSGFASAGISVAEEARQKAAFDL